MLSVIKQIFEPVHPRVRGWSALIRLALVLILVATGLTLWASPSETNLAPDTGDVALYQSVVRDMQGGQDYYTAAVSEARERGYPLHPSLTVRLPALAWVLSALGGDLMQRLAVSALALLAAGAWIFRFAKAGVSPLQFGLAASVCLIGQAAAFVQGGAWLHEVWAGALIALSLALRTEKRWALAVIVGLCAALFRELAVGYLIVMAIVALLEGRRNETIAWSASIGIFALALAAHAARVSELVLPTDGASPGWLALEGWSFVLSGAYWSWSLLKLGWLTVLMLPLALLGLTARPVDLRLTLIVFGYVGAFLFLGRADTSYWGFIYAPLWPIGLLTLMPALTQCRDDLQALRAQPARQ